MAASTKWCLFNLGPLQISSNSMQTNQMRTNLVFLWNICMQQCFFGENLEFINRTLGFLWKVRSLSIVEFGINSNQVPPSRPHPIDYLIRFEAWKAKLTKPASQNLGMLEWSILYTFIRSAHTMGLVTATSPCNKSQGLVAPCELAIFATKSSRRGD